MNVEGVCYRVGTRQRDQRLQLHIVDRRARDRKSTRLNSSHLVISYAVFCLKKKNCRNRQSSTSWPFPTSPPSVTSCSPRSPPSTAYRSPCGHRPSAVLPSCRCSTPNTAALK